MQITMAVPTTILNQAGDLVEGDGKTKMIEQVVGQQRK